MNDLYTLFLTELSRTDGVTTPLQNNRILNLLGGLVSRPNPSASLINQYLVHQGFVSGLNLHFKHITRVINLSELQVGVAGRFKVILDNGSSFFLFQGTPASAVWLGVTATGPTLTHSTACWFLWSDSHSSKRVRTPGGQYLASALCDSILGKKFLARTKNNRNSKC